MPKSGGAQASTSNLLQITLADALAEGPLQVPRTKRGFLFSQGMAGELAALFSLYFQARFYLLSTTLGTLSTAGIPVLTEHMLIRGRYGSAVDPILFSSTPRHFDAALVEFLNHVGELPTKDHFPCLLAAHHYAEALRAIGLDEEMVFVRLVSAVEVVAVTQQLPGDLFVGVSFDDIVRKEQLTPAQQDELRHTFDVRKSMARFGAFQSRAATFLPTDPAQPQHTQITLEALPAVAKAIYHARSAMRQFPTWDMDPSMGQEWQDRTFGPEEKLPHAHFFHRLVRHSLLKYLEERHASSGTNAK